VHLDPSTLLQSPGGPLMTYDLVDLQLPMMQLVEIAERRRPEMAARAAAIAQSQTRVRQERVRPLWPTLSVGYSAGGFGGTGNLTPFVAPFTSLPGRGDFDLWAFWTLRNAGLGNVAVTNQRRAELDRRIGEREAVRARIRTEVGEAYALAVARRRQLSPALRRIRDSEAGFTADYHRLRAGEGLPLESLNSVRLLATARQELVTVIIADTIAQFRLFVALGQPPYRADGFRDGAEVGPEVDAVPIEAP
jgi:outer membrane protein TolC